MVTFPKYESYKDSGVEWLGEIPDSWDTKKLKFVAKQISDKVDMKEQTGNYLGLENIESWTGKIIESELIVEGIANRFQPQDVLFGKLRPYLAKVHLAEQEGFCTTEALVLRFSNQNSRYFFYLLLSQGFIELVNSSVYGSKMPRASWEFIGCQFLPLPTLKEQNIIVEFLDRKTAEIDQAIAQKQRLIELLQEQKAILINQAVTKGLDPNVPMCDRGVEWLGEIPSHWDVKKLKFCCRNNARTLREDTDPQLQIRYIDIGSVSQGKIEKVEHHFFKDAPSRARRLAKQGDTIVSTVRTYLKAISYIKEEYADCVFSTGFSVLSPNNFFDNKFFSYLLQSELFVDEVVRHSKGVSFPAITALELSNFSIAIPLLNEQNRIVIFIERKTSEIDQAIAHEQRFIKLLQEQKSILISQAVTGKLKV